jgi:hypothetical protein
MKRQLFFSFIAAIVITVCGCKKEAIEVHPEMEGHWRTAAVGPGGAVLNITEGTSSYNNYDGSEIHTDGTAKIKGNRLKIGREEFQIIAFPHYDGNGDYLMNIDGSKMIKSITPRTLGVDEFADHAKLYLWFASPSDQGFTHGYFHDRVESLDLQYKLQSETIWTTITGWGNPDYIITGLASASVYQCRIKVHYEWGDSEYSGITTFTTL